MSDLSDEQLGQQWYDQKTRWMVAELGEEFDQVMHAIIPFGIGGSLDLYYFPQPDGGTAVATKELCELPGQGSVNDEFDNYELVMFTRHPLVIEDALNEETPFGSMHRLLNATLNFIACYSAEATLNPRETCEFPEEMRVVGGKCLIFDEFGMSYQKPEFGLLAVIQIHRSEMEYAQAHGGQQLLDRLKAAGYYPYSDLDRPAVV